MDYECVQCGEPVPDARLFCGTECRRKGLAVAEISTFPLQTYLMLWSVKRKGTRQLEGVSTNRTTRTKHTRRPKRKRRKVPRGGKRR